MFPSNLPLCKSPFNVSAGRGLYSRLFYLWPCQRPSVKNGIENIQKKLKSTDDTFDGAREQSCGHV